MKTRQELGEIAWKVYCRETEMIRASDPKMAESHNVLDIFNVVADAVRHAVIADLRTETTIVAYEVKDGVDAVFCETLEDAEMVAAEFSRRAGAIHDQVRVSIECVQISGIPESERAYVDNLKRQINER